MTAVLSPPMVFQGLTPSGQPLSGGLLNTYVAGTSTPQATYTDSTQSQANTNPVVLNASGQASVWLDPTLTYKFILTDSKGNQVAPTVDRIPGGPTAFPQTPSESAAGIVPFATNYLPGDIRRYGAVSGVDATGSIIAANSCNLATYIPAGKWPFTTFTMPTTFGFVLYGEGTASQMQVNGAGIVWPNPGTGGNLFSEQYIRDLAFDATQGTSNVIDCSFTGGNTLLNLYFGNLVSGFNAIKLDGNSAASGDKYTHDMRLKNIQVYTSTACNSGLLIGAFVSDFEVDSFIMNGNVVATYNIQILAGATTGTFTNSHPYNPNINVLNIAAGGAEFTFINCVFDNVVSGLGDIAVLSGVNNCIFDSCWFEAISAGRSGLTLTNCNGTAITSCRWAGSNGAFYTVNETGSSDFTEIVGGSVVGVGSFNNPAVNFVGAHSVAKNVAGINSAGQQASFVGVTSGTVAASSTVFLGANGSQTSSNATYFMIPLSAGMSVQNATITWDIAPGSGSYTLTLQGAGATLSPASGSANPQVATGSGVFSTTINVAPGAAQFVAGFNQVGIKLVTSAGVTATNFRYVINCIG